MAGFSVIASLGLVRSFVRMIARNIARHMIEANVRHPYPVATRPALVYELLCMAVFINVV